MDTIKRPPLTRRSFLNRAAIGCIAVALTPSIPIRGGSEPSDGLSLKFLGTGAADWPPEDYPADKALLLSGQYRGFSSLLVNASVLIDCGPTVPKALSLFQIDPTRGCPLQFYKHPTTRKSLRGVPPSSRCLACGCIK